MNELSLGRVVVAQVRAHPLLDLLDRHALARGVVLHLVLAQLARLEVGAELGLVRVGARVVARVRVSEG